MNKSINLKAIKWDVQEVLEQNPYAFKNTWLVFSFFLIGLTLSGIINNFIPIVAIVIAIIVQVRYYSTLKNQEKKKEVIFFKKKKNERDRNLYAFFIAIFFVWVSRGSGYWLIFSFGIAALYLSKYFFYIPSIVFKAEDYALVIEKGFRRNRIDFTYTNRIRFVSHRMIFENIIDKKVEVKDVEYLPKIDELKEFLSSNFGREKVVSAANGQPLN